LRSANATVAACAINSALPRALACFVESGTGDGLVG
jgi:hypothetical protein